MWARKRKKSRKKSGNDYWQSYSDMMASLLLMFILIMALTLVRSLKTFEDKNADLQRQKITIMQQQEEIDRQKENLRDVQTELTKVTQLVGVKSDIIETLKQEFNSSDLSVKVDEKTGAITFDAGIFFDVDSAWISQEGRQFLQSFVPQYLSVLLSDRFHDSISEIIIEGHTDTNGSYMYNLELSQDRAYNVAVFCLNEQNHVLTKEQIDILRDILTANGRAFSDPIYAEDGTIDMKASRRVVFKFRLKDDEMIEGIQEILGERND